MYTFHHDAFTRESIGRERVYMLADATCQFCGQIHKTPKGRPYLYRYYSVSDGGTVRKYPGLFCGVDCMMAFNG